jgi:hypothetical protein
MGNSEAKSNWEALFNSHDIGLLFSQICTQISVVLQATRCQMETITVVMVWCARCKSKDSITSQAQLNWQGRHQKWMTSKKQVKID